MPSDPDDKKATEVDLVLPGKMADIPPESSVTTSKESLEEGLERSLDAARTTDTAHVVDLADESVRPTEMVQPSMLMQEQSRTRGVNLVLVIVLVATAFLLGVLVGGLAF